MKYSPRPFENLLTRYIARQVKLIEELYRQFYYDAASASLRVNPPKDKDFYFRDYPALSKQVDTLLRGLSSRLTKTITSGIEWSWELANAKNDNLLDKIVKSIGADRIPANVLERWNQKNLPALYAFEERRISGMNLSDRVWSYTKNMKGNLELALDLGIGEGMSADRLSRAVREYLNEPSKLFRRVRDKKGELRLSKNAREYHPGQGVYRSSYKNARRLTATETNMAYRTSDNERMNEMDWILGYEVHISDTNHTCLDSKGVPQPFYDICDELQGRYPKWFKFVGWHPLCRCYVTTILPERSEMIKYLAAMDENGHSSYKLQGEVTDVPPQFKEWVENNAERIERAEDKGTLPYFLKDNPDAWDKKEVAYFAERNRQINEIVSRAKEEGQMTQSDIEKLNSLAPNMVLSDIYDTGNGWEKSRLPIHQRIVATYIGDGSVKSDTVYMLGGAPANGKSTVVDSGMIKYPKGIITLDVDKVKRAIPEYGLSEMSGVKGVRDNAANFVHEESSHLGKVIQSSVFGRGESLVIDGVNDGSFEKVQSKVVKIKEQTGGLRIRADYVTCDTEESIRRNQARYEKTGRLVKPEVVIHDNKAISQLFPKLIEHKTFDELYLWDTNSPDGARMVLRMIDGKLEIMDEGLYKRFLAKGR